MITLYGSAQSRAVRVIWMAGELGLSYNHKPYAPRSPETRTPEYRALNPNGRVPTIVDDGFVLSESMAINIFLAKQHNSPLYPADIKAQALVLQWSLWETDRLDRQLVAYYAQIEGLPAAERKPEIAEAHRKEVEPALDVLEGALAKSPYLTGAHFTLADLNVASALFRGLSMDLTKWPHLRKWLETCWARPAGRRARAMREGKG